MSNKKLYCYTFDIMKNGKIGENKRNIIYYKFIV